MRERGKGRCKVKASTIVDVDTAIAMEVGTWVSRGRMHGEPMGETAVTKARPDERCIRRLEDMHSNALLTMDEAARRGSEGRCPIHTVTATVVPRAVVVANQHTMTCPLDWA